MDSRLRGNDGQGGNWLGGPGWRAGRDACPTDKVGRVGTGDCFGPAVLATTT
ncbi:hypothetical protein ACFL4G_06405 [Thermodesulfobacteriota bacterium]